MINMECFLVNAIAIANKCDVPTRVQLKMVKSEQF